MIKKLILFFLVTTIGLACSQLKALKRMKKGEPGIKNFTTKIPFELRSGLIIVKVKLNNETQPREFILDTGAPNVFTSDVIKALGLKAQKAMQGSDAGGQKQDIQQVMIDRIAFGDLPFNNHLAFVSDINNVNEINCLKVDGLIGSNLMQHANWLIDYEAKEITCTDGALPKPAGETPTVLPFKAMVQGTPLVTLKIDGQEVSMIFDTGKSSRVLSVNASTYTKLITGKNAAELTGYGVLASGAFGNVRDTIRIAQLRTLQIGSNFVTDTVLVQHSNSQGLCGNGTLMNYFSKVGIDWKAGEIYLYPRKEKGKETFEAFGCSFIKKETALVIGALFDRSAAQASGLHIGDTLVRVNGQDVTGLTRESYCEVLNLFGINNNRLEIMRKGDSKMIVLNRTDLLKN
jgi:predicted aspartyl protease